MGAGDGKPQADSKRKMTQAIIEEQDEAAKKNKKDAYDFLEDDDDFEEFEIAGEQADEDAVMAGDAAAVLSGLEATEKKLWQEDWDDEEVDEDFAKQLRAQIRK